MLRVRACGRLAAGDPGERIEPPQCRKPEKVGIGRVQDGIGFEDERGNLCVGHEIAGGAQRLEKGEHPFEVIGARFQYLNDRLRQPGADVTGGGQSQGNSWAGDGPYAQFLAPQLSGRARF